jgi:hypothetical protein
MGIKNTCKLVMVLWIFELIIQRGVALDRTTTKRCIAEG